jgi:hypothetical protein
MEFDGVMPERAGSGCRRDYTSVLPVFVKPME